MSTLAAVLAQASAQLAAAGIPTARLDAQVLLCHVLGVGRCVLYSAPDRAVSATAQAEFERVLARRVAGEPIAYLLGAKEFWSRKFEVNNAVLIPRPETELLVAWCLGELTHDRVVGGDSLSTPTADAPLRVLDLGAGSGAIAVTLALERPVWQVSAVEQSTDALAVAQRNAAHLGADNIMWHCGDWLAPVAGEDFEVIVSNPPYIEGADPLLGEGDVRFEPRTALVAENDGLADLLAIIVGARAHLVEGGVLVLEHGATQQEAVVQLLEAADYNGIQRFCDYAGLPRMVVARC